MASIGDLILRIIADASGLQAEIEKKAGAAAEKAAPTIAGRLSAGLTRAGRSLAATGKSLTMNVTAPIVGLGAAIFQVGAEFDTTLRQITALTGTTADEIGAVRDRILSLATDIGKTPQELAEGFYFLASAGFTTNEALEVLNSTAKASAAGLGSTADISRVVGAAINAFGKENLTAGDAVDQLLRAIKDGTAEAPEFANVLGSVLGSAAQLGATFADTSAAIAAMTLKGISADEAATSLNQIFVSLLKTTPQASRAFADVGLSAEGLRSELRERGLLSVLQTLSAAFEGNDTAAAAAFGNIRALRGVLALTSGDAAQVAAVFDDVANGTANLGSAFEATEGPGRAMDRAIARIQVALIQLSADVLPVVADILERISSIISAVAGAFTALPGPVRQGLLVLAALAATAGPVLFVVGKLTSGVGALIGAFVKLRAIATVVGPALGRALGGAPVVGALSEGLGSALAKVRGSAPVMKATNALGKFLGSTLGKAAAVAFAAFAVVEVIQTYNEIKGRLGEQTEAIGTDIAKQIARGTTAELKQSKAAVEKGLADLNSVWDLGIFSADTRSSLQAQLEAIDGELARRASGMPSTVAGELEDGQGEVAAGAEEMLEGVPGAVEQAAEDAAAAAREIVPAIAGEIRSRRTDVESAIDGLNEAIDKGLTKAEEIARFKKIGRQIRDDLISEKPEVRAAALEVAQKVEEGLEALGEGPFDWGASVPEDVVRAIRGKQITAEEAGRTLGRWVVGGAESVDGGGAGQSLADEVVSGVSRPPEDRLREQARALVRKVFNAVKLAAAAYGSAVTGFLFGGTVSGAVVQTGGRVRAMQHGGSFGAFEPFIAGEGGRPELVIPSAPGAVIPHVDSRRLLGETVVNNTVRVDGFVAARDRFEILEEMRRFSELGVFDPPKPSLVVGGRE